jgi:heat shock protein HtpX
MFTFEDHIRANKSKTAGLIFAFIVVMAGLGYFAGFLLADKPEDGPAFGFFLMALAIVFSIFSSGISFWFSDRIITSMVGARPANPNVYIERYFSDTLEGLVLACGLPAIPRSYVIESPALNAFATGRDPQHALICVTTGLLEKLDREELEGVIAHEMSHIYNRDILLMGVAAVLVGGIAMFCHMVTRILWYGGGGRSSNSRDRDSGGAGILMLIGIVFIILAPIFANLLNLMLSRKREFLADATSVKLTRNPDGLVRALKKISASPEKMPEVEEELAALFIDHPQKKHSPGGWFTGLFATHPPVDDRIHALENM